MNVLEGSMFVLFYCHNYTYMNVVFYVSHLIKSSILSSHHLKNSRTSLAFVKFSSSISYFKNQRNHVLDGLRRIAEMPFVRLQTLVQKLWTVVYSSWFYLRKRKRFKYTVLSIKDMQTIVIPKFYDKNTIICSSYTRILSTI